MIHINSETRQRITVFFSIQGTINSGQFASEVIRGHRLVKEDDGDSF
jgi:hypothetical protein